MGFRELSSACSALEEACLAGGGFADELAAARRAGRAVLERVSDLLTELAAGEQDGPRAMRA